MAKKRKDNDACDPEAMRFELEKLEISDEFVARRIGGFAFYDSQEDKPVTQYPLTSFRSRNLGLSLYRETQCLLFR
jgi:hypothetical protein